MSDSLTDAGPTSPPSRFLPVLFVLVVVAVAAFAGVSRALQSSQMKWNLQIRDDGRLLLERMQRDSIDVLYPTSELVPESIRQLDPVYVRAREGHLLVVLSTASRSPSLHIFEADVAGQGMQRLAPGLWLFEPGDNRRITDAEWDAGVRQ